MKHFAASLILFFLLFKSCGCQSAKRSEDGLASDPEYLEGNQVIFLEQGTLANQIGFVHVKMVYHLGEVKTTVESALSQLGKIVETEKPV